MKKIITTVVLSTFIMSSFMSSFVDAAKTTQVKNNEAIRLGFVPEVDMAAQNLSKTTAGLKAVILKGNEVIADQAELNKFKANNNKFVIVSPDKEILEMKDDDVADVNEIKEAIEDIKSKYNANAVETRSPYLSDSAGITLSADNLKKSMAALVQVAKQSKTPFTQGYRMADIELDTNLNGELNDFYRERFYEIIEANYDGKKLNDLYFNFALLAKNKKEFDELRKIIEEKLIFVLKDTIKGFKDADIGNLIAYTVLPNIADKEKIKKEMQGKVRFLAEEKVEE